ncbi:MAG: hypothetical protein S4CHLAM37_04690 [Chlamydiia bacterium]|nr:hypothetical protein [Chlamydiia bacterium]
MRTVVVVGANRGIGLGFVKMHLEKGDKVVATYRTKCSTVALQALKETYGCSLQLRKVDVTDENDVSRLHRGVKKVHLLILSAGTKGYPVSGTQTIENTTSELQKALEVNVTGHDRIVRGFYKKLSHSNRCVVYLSSGVSSTQDNLSGGYHPYRISKAAGNAMIWNWNLQLAKGWRHKNKDMQKVPCTFAICPGWVKTDMGGASARLTVDQSVGAMSRVIDNVIRTKDSAALFMHDGTKLEKYRNPLHETIV